MPSTSASLGLFLSGGTPEFEGGSLDFFTFGSSGSGFYRGLDLFVYCGPDGNVKEAELPLFLSAPASGSCATSMNLFTEGWYSRADASLDLTVFNELSGATGVLPLYCRGAGVSAGAMPYETSLPLVVKSDPREILPLFLLGPGNPVGSGIDLFCQGSVGVTSSLDLYCSGIGVAESALKLFTHGF